MFSLRTLCVVAAAFATFACDEAPPEARIELTPRLAELDAAQAEALCADLEAMLAPAGERFACALETTLLTIDPGTCERHRLRCEPEKPDVCPYRDPAVRGACSARVEEVTACFDALRGGIEAATERLSCSVAGDREAKEAAFESLEGLLARPAACAALPAECLPQQAEEAPSEDVTTPPVDVSEPAPTEEAPIETGDFDSQTYGAGDWGVTLTADSEVALCALQVVCPNGGSVVSFGGALTAEGDDLERMMAGENLCSDGGRPATVPLGGRISAWSVGRADGCEVVIEASGSYRIHRCDPTATEEVCTASEPVLTTHGSASLRF